MSSSAVLEPCNPRPVDPWPENQLGTLLVKAKIQSDEHCLIGSSEVLELLYPRSDDPWPKNQLVTLLVKVHIVISLLT
jgi:hypothetical protein